MDLRTFVFESLTQIVAGVADAKKFIEEMNVGAAVNPDIAYNNQRNVSGSDVAFDVAITIANANRSAEQQGIDGSAGGFLAVAGAKVSGSSGDSASREDSEEAVSRVRFVVKLAQPANIEARRSPTIPAQKSAWVA